MSNDPITPSSLDTVAAGRKPQRNGPPPLAWLLPLLLLVGGTVLLLFLKQQQPVQRLPDPTPTPAPVAIPTEDPALRLEAEALLEEVLEQRRHWEIRGAGDWAGATWSNLLQAVGQGDAAFVAKGYADSKAAYTQALREMESLTGQEGEAVPRLLAQARAQYAEGRREEALSRLEAVLVLEAGHAAAKELMPRARVCDQTFHRLKQGRTAVAQDDLAKAFVELEAATQLDADFPGLARLRDEVRSTLAEQEFQNLISDGLLALQRGDLDSAETLLRKAANFQPGDSAVEDAQQQVAEAKLARQVAAALQTASALEAAEDLQNAYKAYLAVLQLDPEAAAAERGKERVAGFLALEDKLRKFEGAWWSAETSALVEDLRAERSGTLPSSLAKRVERFVETWTRAHTPRSVVLTSDGNSMVQLQGQAAWQPFERKQLELKPGRYVIKAWARGFVDLRETVFIPLDGEVPLIDIRVREAL